MSVLLVPVAVIPRDVLANYNAKCGCGKPGVLAVVHVSSSGVMASAILDRYTLACFCAEHAAEVRLS